MNTNELQDPGAPDSPGDPATFEQHYYDSRGVAPVYQMILEGGIWKLWREAPRLTAVPANELLGQRVRQCGRPRVSQ
jgi:hypothetical protein